MTGITPTALQNRPRLKPYQKMLLGTFYEISGGRSYGMAGPQPVTSGEILAYCELLGIRQLEERDGLFRTVRSLDAAFLTAYYEKQGRDAKSKGER